MMKDKRSNNRKSKTEPLSDPKHLDIFKHQLIKKDEVLNCNELTMSQKRYRHGSDIVYGIIEYQNLNEPVETQLYILGKDNLEYISSAVIHVNGKLKLDYSSIAILAHKTTELGSINRKFSQIGTQLLLNESAIVAGLLWQVDLNKELEPDVQQLIRLLSQILFQLQQFISPPYAAASHKAGIKTNGCTAVPDFNFKECCDAHDICYGIGGSESDRLKCDEKLRECIKEHGHPILAELYYYGVRSFGVSHFTYQFDNEHEDGTSTPVFPAPGTTSTKCKFTIYLTKVAYNGEDIGNDWKYKIKVHDGAWVSLGNGSGNMDHNTYDFNIVKEKVYEKEVNCGDPINVSIAVVATEVDATSNDNGNNSKQFSFKCDGGQYETTINVAVIDDTFINETAQLTFTFMAETKCGDS